MDCAYADVVANISCLFARVRRARHRENSIVNAATITSRAAMSLIKKRTIVGMRSWQVAKPVTRSLTATNLRLGE
jgi:hypothetical protein